jgi:REP element-mobilizing transposase RayT
LKGPISGRLQQFFAQCAEINRWQITELNIQEDYIHMIAQLRQNVSVSKVAQLLKGGSSKVI